MAEDKGNKIPELMTPIWQISDGKFVVTEEGVAREEGISPIGTGLRDGEIDPLTFVAATGTWTSLTVHFAGAVSHEQAQKMLDKATKGVGNLGEMPSIEPYGDNLIVKFGFAAPICEEERLDALHRVAKNLESFCMKAGRFPGKAAQTPEQIPGWRCMDISTTGSRCELYMVRSDVSSKVLEPA